MLSDMLSSKPKSRIVNLFLAHPARAFSATELKASTEASTMILKTTLRELTKMGFLLILEKKRHKYFQVNRHFALYPELVSTLRTQKNIPPDLVAQAAAKVGECKLVVLTGVFAGRTRVESDVLFVGRVSPKKLSKFIKLAEKFAEQEISYTLFSSSEFEYRKIMNDRFLKNILENNPVIVIDRTKTLNRTR